MTEEKYQHRELVYNFIVMEAMELQKELMNLPVPNEYAFDNIYADVAAKVIVLRGSMEAAKENLSEDQCKMIFNMVDFLMNTTDVLESRAFIFREIYGEKEPVN